MGLQFTSYSGAWQWWGETYGPAVTGAGNNINVFTADLLGVNYNSQKPPLGDPNWANEVNATLPGVQKRLNQWLNGAPTCN